MCRDARLERSRGRGWVPLPLKLSVCAPPRARLVNCVVIVARLRVFPGNTQRCNAGTVWTRRAREGWEYMGRAGSRRQQPAASIFHSRVRSRLSAVGISAVRSGRGSGFITFIWRLGLHGGAASELCQSPQVHPPSRAPKLTCRLPSCRRQASSTRQDKPFSRLVKAVNPQWCAAQGLGQTHASPFTLHFYILISTLSIHFCILLYVPLFHTHFTFLFRSAFSAALLPTAFSASVAEI